VSREGSSKVELELHTPEGINYECTGCGKCCGGWAVPLTQDDYERISEIEWADELAKFEGEDLFRPLKAYESVNTPYTHAIKEGEDGHCPFLVNNLCFIHSTRDSKTKPSICQLFPYCFNETPSGVFATVSFLSMGAVYNSGKSLSEQHDYLRLKYEDFKSLFPDHHPNWSKLQLTVGQPITWEQYLEYESKILACLKTEMPFRDRLLAASSFLVGLAKPGQQTGKATDQTTASQVDLNDIGPLNQLDRVLIANLHRLYFPVKPIKRGEGDFKVSRLVFEATLGPALGTLKIEVPSGRFSLDSLASINWPEDDQEIKDILYRYFYSRVFAKLYFAAGFGQLSLIVGFHHLAVIYALIRWHAKALARGRDAKTVSLIDVVATVRQLEKRLGETAVSGYAAATFELLLFSPQRLRRLLKAST
jgi:Fe-S-cluster containining protein